MPNYRISDEGKKWLAQLEGFENRVYKDIAGYPTIGVGHKLTKSEISSGKIYINDEWVRYGDGLTNRQVYDLLDQDLDRFERAVNKYVTADINQKEFDALVSFAFNVGVNAFKNSTLLKKLNTGQHSEVPQQLRRWVYSGGQKSAGLINRREHEVDLFRDGTYRV